MNLTTLFRLRKPEGTDPVDVKDFNDNFDVIDAELGKRPEKTGNASNMVTSFSQAGSRVNLTSGEQLAVSMGKIMKFFADLKAVAFSGSYTDLSNKPTIPSGAAASYPVANNDTTNNAGYLVTAQVAYTHGREIDQLSSDLGRVRVYVGSDGKIHFTNSAGADSALPFSRGSTVIYLGTGYSFNITGYSGWQSFTADNFIVGALSGAASKSSGHGEYNTYAKIDGFSISKSYDASRGILTIGGYSQTAGCWDIDNYYRYTTNQNMVCFAYLIM